MKKTKQIFSSLVILTMIIPYTAFGGLPVSDVGNSANHGINTFLTGFGSGTDWKELMMDLLKQIGAQVASQLLNKFTESTVNWINSGFEENPQYVSDPKSFFKEVGDTQIKSVVDTVGYDLQKFPFGRNTAVQLIKEYAAKDKPLDQKATFTLDKIVGTNWRNYDTSYSSKFADAVVTNPANTPLGAYFTAKQKFESEFTRANEKINKMLDRSGGFLDQQVCTRFRDPAKKASGGTSANNQSLANQAAQANSNPRATPSTSGNTNAINTGIQDPNNPSSNPQIQAPNSNLDVFGVDMDKDCLEHKSVSPGSIVESQITKSLAAKTVDRPALQSVVGDVAGSIGAIVNALTNQLINKGLGALSSAGQGNNTPDEDKWEYQGYTLTGKTPTSTTGQVDYSSDRIIDFDEILITGEPDKTEVIVDPDTGEQTIKVITRKKTAIDLTREEANYYLRIAELIDGNKSKNITPLVEHIANLDHCVPGPDYNWEKRFDDRIDRVKQKLSRQLTAKNEKKANRASDDLEAIEDGADKMKREIRLGVLNNIPSYVKLNDLVWRTNRYSQKAKENYEKYTEKITAIAQLQSIKTDYLRIKQNPQTAGIQMSDLLKRYSAIQADIANDLTLSVARDNYDKIQIGYDELVEGLKICRQEKGNSPRSFSIGDVTANAYDSVGTTEEPGTDPVDLKNTGMVFLNTPPTDIPNKVRVEFPDISQTNVASIGGMADEDIVLFYSIIKAYSTNAGVQGLIGGSLTGDALFTAIKTYLDNLVDYGNIPVKVTNEVNYYCWSHMKAMSYRGPAGLTNKSVKLTCSDFYTTDIFDYKIEKNY